jgi:hypothetical protein
VRAVVGGVEHQGVVGDAQFVQQIEELADVHVVLDHAVGVLVLPGDAAQLLFHVGAEVHARAVPPHEPGLAGLVLLADELDRAIRGLVVHGFHALLRQRPGILDLAAGK